MANCNNKRKVFKTSEASTKAWFRTRNIIDKYLNILDLKEFRKQNTKWSNYARIKYGTNEPLFFEDSNGTKALPNSKMFIQIDSTSLDKSVNNRLLPNKMFSLQNYNQEPQDESEELNKHLSSLLSKFGITVKDLDEFTEDRLGGDPYAMADIANKTIYVAAGKGSYLPEEAAHFIVELAGNDPLMKRLIGLAEQSDHYKSVKEDYSEVYDNNENKIRKEAIGKSLADAIYNKWKNKDDSSFIRVLKAIYNKIMSTLKTIFGSKAHADFESLIGAVAQDIVKGKTNILSLEALANSKEGLFYHLPKVTLETKQRISYAVKEVSSEFDLKRLKNKHEYYNEKLKESYRAVSDILAEVFGKAQASEMMEEASRIGTAIHYTAEGFFKNKNLTGKISAETGYSLTKEAREQFKAILESEFPIEDAAYITEAIVADRDSKVAGTIDLIVIDNLGNVYIYDFKTSMSGFPNYEKYYRKKHELQLTLYKKMLEKMIGYGKVKTINIVKLQPHVEGNKITKMNLVGVERDMEENKEYKKFIKKEATKKTKGKYEPLSGNIGYAQDILQKSIKAIEKRIAILNATGHNTSREKDLLSELREHESDKHYLIGVMDTLFALNEVMVGEEDNKDSVGLVEKMYRLRTKIQEGFNMADLQEASKDLRETRKFVEAYRPLLKNVNSMISRMKYDGKSIPDGLEESVAAMSGNLDTLDDEFTALASKVWSSFLEQYLGQRNTNKDITKRLGVLDIESVIKQADRDITFMMRWFDSMAETSDDLLGLIDAAVKHYKMISEQESLDTIKDLLDVQERMKAKGLSDLSFVYEKNSKGELTGHLLSEDGYNWGEFLDAQRKFYSDLRAKYKLEKGQTKNDLSEEDKEAFSEAEFMWWSSNLSKNWKDLLDKKKDELDDVQYERYFEDNIISTYNYETGKYEDAPKKGSELRVPHEKYKYKISLTEDQKEFLSFIWKIKKEIDSGLPPRYSKLRLAPQIRQDWVEALKKGGLMNKVYGLGDYLSEMFQKKEDEEGFEDSSNLLTGLKSEFENLKTELTDESGRPVNLLPLYFVNRLKDTKNLSTDIIGSMALYVVMGNDYKNMSKIVDTLEVGRFLMEDRNVGKVDSKGKKIIEAIATSTKGDQSSSKGASSLIYGRYVDYLSMVVYGKQKIEGKSVNIFGKDVSLEKVADSFGKYTAINALALNIYAGVNNVILASSLTRVEAFAGEFFDHKDLLFGDTTYYKHLPEFIYELGLVNPKNKLQLWIEKFNALQNFNEYAHGLNASRNTRVSVLAQLSHLFFLNHAGEHYIQTRISLAAANRVKLKDKNGKEVNLFDAHEVVGNKLVLKEEFKNQFTQEDFRKFINRQNYINKSLNGIYNEVDKSSVQKMAVGRLMMMFRKFIKPGVNRRFRKAYMNYESDNLTEGYYRTTGRFLSGLFQDLKRGQFLIMSHWKSLSDQEKMNLYRTFAEAGYTLVTLAAVGIVANIKGNDDDDDWSLNMLAYQANRLQTELLFYLDPRETFRILKSPAAAVNQGQNVVDFLTTILTRAGWTEELQSGRYKGYTRVERRLVDVIPLYKTVGKIMYPEDQLKFFTKSY